MKSFLEEISENLFNEYGNDLGQLTIVFPNKRAGLFFTRAISGLISRPVWSPEIKSIEEFVYSLSGKKPAERLYLLLDLFKAYQKVTGFEESFDRFYYWGDMLLTDFDDLDKYLVDPRQVFSAIKSLKEIDAEFSFLTDEQKNVIRDFWGSMAGRNSDHKEGFLRFWQSLPAIYRAFSESLDQEGNSYPGKIYREVARNIIDEKFHWDGRQVIFAGFNALTKAEEIIIQWFVSQKHGKIFWDTDSHYLNNPWHEAGTFQRNYLRDRVLRDTFPKILPSNLLRTDKVIEIISTSSGSAQAQWAADKIIEIKKSGLLENPVKTVIVLPDESMIISLIQALPHDIDKINITVAYPVRTVPLFSFFELIIELHEYKRVSTHGTWFNHVQVMFLLAHPVVQALMSDKALEIINRIKEQNKIYIPANLLSAGGILSEIFVASLDEDRILEYLANLVQFLPVPGNKESYGWEFHYYFYKLFHRLNHAFRQKGVPLTVVLVKKLFRQLSRIERVSFTGEPLEGLQVMGILETRNLDFDNVIILDANEGLLPKAGSHNSFIPYNIRKVFNLPNYEHSGSIHAYLFYRLLQRSERVWIVYNTEDTGKGTGEPSRFVQQLRYETGYKTVEKVLVQDLLIHPVAPLLIQKNPDIAESLARYIHDESREERSLTPSALTTYLDCPINFYFKYVLEIKENQKVQSEFDSMLFGNILHKTMEGIYTKALQENNGLVTPDYITDARKNIPGRVKKSFAHCFGFEKPGDFEFEGRNILGREIIIRLIEKILFLDEQYAPFRILGMEMKIKYLLPVVLKGNQSLINMKGIVDRVDEKEGRVRIVDYKTGRDSGKFDSVAGLFGADEKKRNKAVFQTLFYAMITAGIGTSGSCPVPALYNARELYLDDFNPLVRIGKGGNSIPLDEPTLTETVFPEFRENLQRLTEELMNIGIPFGHREPRVPCKFCARAGFPQ